MIYKHHKPSGFFGTELAALMNYEHIDTAVVTGMTTTAARATAVDVLQHNFDVVIPFECRPQPDLAQGEPARPAHEVRGRCAARRRDRLPARADLTPPAVSLGDHTVDGVDDGVGSLALDVVGGVGDGDHLGAGHAGRPLRLGLPLRAVLNPSNSAWVNGAFSGSGSSLTTRPRLTMITGMSRGPAASISSNRVPRS